MGKLVWRNLDNGAWLPRYEARGDLALYTVGPTARGEYALFIDGYLTAEFDSSDEAKAEAEEHDARDEDPNNTFRGDFAGFAENH